MNILDRYRRKLEKNKETNKVLKRKAYERYQEAYKQRSKELYVESKLKILRQDYNRGNI